MVNRLLRAERRAIAFVVAATLSLIMAAWPSPISGHAYASDDSAAVQTTDASTPNGVTCGVASVHKTYPTDQAMAITMAGGDTTTIATTDSGSRVKWTNSNTRVVKVMPIGKYSAKVIALKPGKATVLAKSDSQSITCSIAVTGALNKRSVALLPWQSSRLQLAGAKTKSWKSSNTRVVKVGANGKLTPMRSGKATVTCTDRAGYKYACTVIVKAPPITCKTPFVPYPHTTFPFLLTNKSRRAITLNSNMLHYPATHSNANLLLNTFGPSNLPLATKPLTVRSSENATFVGKSESAALLSRTGYVKVGFKVGKVPYLAMFSPYTGKILACGRAQ